MQATSPSLIISSYSPLRRRRTTQDLPATPPAAKSAAETAEGQNWSPESYSSLSSGASSVETDPHCFPRESYELQSACDGAWVATMTRAEPHLHFSARVASAEWRRLARTGSLQDVDLDLFKLAILDKFFYLCVIKAMISNDANVRCQIRRRRDGRLSSYEAWRGWADSRIREIVEIVSRLFNQCFG